MKRPEPLPKVVDILSKGPVGWVPEIMELVKQYNDRYLYWSDLKYRDVELQLCEILWAVIKICRDNSIRIVKLMD